MISIEDQIAFVELQIKIWSGHTKQHKERQQMYTAILNSLNELKKERLNNEWKDKEMEDQ